MRFRPTRTITRAITRAVAATAVAMLAAPLLGIAGPSMAAADDTSATTGDESTGRMMLVLDSSGSMSEPAAGGVSKIQAARSALTTVIGDLDDAQPVGLRVYGATVFSRDDAGACTDSQQVVEPATDNRDELLAEVRRYRPYGETPIGYALEQAADDLGAEGDRTIVLVSDGEATCPPDPCQVAARIAADGIDVRIDVVGLDVSGTARSQLQCIAAAGGGTYYDANDADDLRSSLDRSSARAARPFGFQGTPVEGTPELDASTPTIGSGAWVDTLGEVASPTGRRTYLVERSIPASALHVSASILGNGGRQEALTVQARGVTESGPGGECDEQQEFQQLDSQELTSTGVVVGPDTLYDDQSRACRLGDQVLITVSRGTSDGSLAGQGEVPLALYVVEEPPVENADALPPAADDPEITVRYPEPGDGPAVVGGSSFDDAPVLEPGDFTSDIVPGETQLFLVELDWGQRLQAAVTFPRLGGAANRAGVGHLGLYGSTRRPADALFGSDQISLGSDRSTMDSSTYPVRYHNRGFSNQLGAALPGRYAIEVSVDDSANGPAEPWTYALRVQVDGTTAGEPTYVGGSLTEPTPSEPTTPTADPTTGGSDDGDATAADDAADEGGDGVLLPIGLGGAGAVALAGAVLLAVRARRSP